MDTRSQIGLLLLLILYAVQVVVSAPAPARTWYSAVDPGYRIRSGEKETGRIFWSAVGDILEALPFLPFTINVPDAIAGMWNFVTGFFPDGGSGNKKPKGNSTAEAGLTRDDLIDYFLY